MFSWFSRKFRFRADAEALYALEKEAVEHLLEAIKTNTVKPFDDLVIPKTYMDRTKRASYSWAIDGKRHHATFHYSEYRGLTRMTECELKLTFKRDRFVKAHLELYVRQPWDDADTVRHALTCWLRQHIERDANHAEPSARVVYPDFHRKEIRKVH